MASDKDLLQPKFLSKGDTIGIVAPAAQLVDEDAFGDGLQIIEEMGFTVRYPRDLWPGHHYLSATDEERAEEFHRMWMSDDVDALLCVRGGFGCLRLAPFLDGSVLSRSPKLLIGFSDITVLHAFLFEKWNVMSMHGPVLTSLSSTSRESKEQFFHSLTGNCFSTISPKFPELLRKGDTFNFAPLIGGNLNTLLSLAETPFDLNYSGKLLFLEDINEPPYKIDRMFTQLGLSGKLSDLSGLILGDFSMQHHQDEIERLRYREYVWKRVLEVTEGTNYPILAGFPIGHGSDNVTLPFGCPARLNISRCSLEFA